MASLWIKYKLKLNLFLLDREENSKLNIQSKALKKCPSRMNKNFLRIVFNFEKK